MKKLNVELRFIPASLLKIDPAYQREPNLNRLSRNIKAFQSGAVKTVSVSERSNGDLYLYDGQHTLFSLCKLGIEQIPCAVVKGTQEEEAKWFLLMNGSGVSKASSRDKHKARAACNDEDVKNINAMLERFGVVVAKGGSKPGTTSAIGSITSWYKSDKARLEVVMDNIFRIWMTNESAWTQVLMRGMWDVAGSGKMDQVRLGLAKHKITPRRVLDTAKGMQMATGTPGGGSGYCKKAIFKLAKVAE